MFLPRQGVKRRRDRNMMLDLFRLVIQYRGPVLPPPEPWARPGGKQHRFAQRSFSRASLTQNTDVTKFVEFRCSHSYGIPPCAISALLLLLPAVNSCHK